MEQDTIELPQPQETILVVEDEVLVRMPISQYLRDCGYRVIEAANAQEAVTVLSHEETVVDVVFTDIEMPGALDGFGLAKWVREHRPGVDYGFWRPPLVGRSKSRAFTPRAVDSSYNVTTADYGRSHARLPRSS